MTGSLKAIVGLMVSAVLSAGCSKSGLSGVDCTLAACLGDAGYLPPDTASPGEDVRPDTGAFADTKSAPDLASDVKPPPDVASDTKPGTDGKFSPGAGDLAKDTGPTCVLPDGGPGQFDCYVCTCIGDQASCDFVGCPADAGNALCTLPTAVTFGATGGMVSYEDQYKLAPASGLIITRNYNGRGSGSVDGATVRSCTPTLPACGETSVVSLSTIVADLAAADVQAAFALGTTPIYGVDSRPVDGSIWSITLASGGSILVGSPCPSPTMSSCRTTPTGVQKLADDLQSLATAMLAQNACSGL